MTEPKPSPLGTEPTIAAPLSGPATRPEEFLAATMDAVVSEPAIVDVAAPAMTELPFDGRYEMRRVLGAGGMGEVRLYKDRRIGREIAVKVMHSGAVASASALERFFREARVQGQLEHPAVVPVYDLGVHGNGAAFFSMKRVRGRTLDEIVRQLAAGDAETRVKYSRRKLLTAFANVCLSIDFAHSRGVLHRDLKPANVMLGDFGEVHVLDWGIAKIVGASETVPEAEHIDAVVQGTQPGAGQTVSGAVIGTPGYMAPEQARGLLDRLDARTDVYALGAILFEMLALVPLHDGATVAERLVSTIEGRDPLPSRRALGNDIPPELDAICARALATEASERYPTARALGDAVEQFLDGDRDLERRRALAGERLERARTAVEGAKGARGEGAHKARGEAIRDVTRALALDPDNRAAAAMLAQLFVDAPDEIPPEAEKELAQSNLEGQRNTARISAARVFALALFVPLLFAFGMRSLPILAVIVGGMLTAGASNLAWWRVGDGRPGHPFGRLAVVSSTAAICALAYLYGPYVLVPMMSFLNLMLFAVQTDFRMKRTLIACAPLPVLLPVLLDLVGVGSGGWQFLGDHIVIPARLVSFPPVLSPLFLTAASAMMTTVPIVVIGKLREALARSERRNFMHAWHLRKLAG